MSDKWTERLSDYLDDELSEADRGKLELHLEACEECTLTLDQLRRVVARAHELEDRPPATDLWSGIADRIGTAPAGDGEVVDLEEHRRVRQRWLRARFSFSFPQLVAASVALMILSSGTAWLLLSSGGPPGSVVPAEGVAPAQLVSDPLTDFAARKYGTAIADLLGVLTEQRSQLDTATVRIIEENLMIIDRAIVEARRALAEDPGSSYLSEHLARTMRQKLEYLRHATAITGSAS